MSRLIDADALGASVIKNTVFDKGDVIKLIEDAPSIEIVRCKECKWCYKDTDALTSQTVLICQRYNDEDRWARVNSDDFCSYGCRSEKPNTSTISKMEQVGKE